MNPYLSNLLSRSMEPAETVRPRRASRFEPWQAASGAATSREEITLSVETGQETPAPPVRQGDRPGPAPPERPATASSPRLEAAPRPAPPGTPVPPAPGPAGPAAAPPDAPGHGRPQPMPPEPPADPARTVSVHAEPPALRRRPAEARGPEAGPQPPRGRLVSPPEEASEGPPVAVPATQALPPARASDPEIPRCPVPPREVLEAAAPEAVAPRTPPLPPGAGRRTPPLRPVPRPGEAYGGTPPEALPPLEAPARRPAPGGTEPAPRSTAPRTQPEAAMPGPAVTPKVVEGARTQEPLPQTPADEAPTIRISIGRIEVRAVTPPAQPRRKPARPAPALSLDEYLKQQHERRP